MASKTPPGFQADRERTQLVEVTRQTAPKCSERMDSTASLIACLVKSRFVYYRVIAPTSCGLRARQSSCKAAKPLSEERSFMVLLHTQRRQWSGRKGRPQGKLGGVVRGGGRVWGRWAAQKHPGRMFSNPRSRWSRGGRQQSEEVGERSIERDLRRVGRINGG
jgi:hypothetical protein